MKKIIVLFINKILKQFNVGSLPDKLDFKGLSQIKEISTSKLTDPIYLEEELIPNLGLNDEELHEFPLELLKYTGQGLYMWQYPNQLANYLSFLSKIKINNFMEIGCRWGGTFALTYEFLLKFNPTIKGHCIDIVESKSLRKYVSKNENIKYSILGSNQKEFKELYRKTHFDLVFIDGDHSFKGCFNDFKFFESRADIFVFHDIVSDVCPGVVMTWKIIKQSNQYQIYEFDTQYDEVYERTGKKYLGIGVAIKKDSKFLINAK